MKPETLNALLLDRELGELPPDVAELLEAYLESAPPAQREAEAVAQTVRTAREAVQRFPELLPRSDARPRVIALAPWIAPWLARAAALVAIAGLAAWVGYRTGTSGVAQESTRPAEPGEVRMIASQPASGEFKELWARYDVTYDGRRGAFTVAKQP